MGHVVFVFRYEVEVCPKKLLFAEHFGQCDL